MIPTVSLLTVIGLTLALALWYVQWASSKDAEKKKAQDEIDKEIDNANDAGSLFKLFNKLRNK